MPTTERVGFPGAHGAELAARLERPDTEPRAHALFAHCFTCGKDLNAVRWISRALAERGFAVLRFDFTGLGESEGEFADTDFSSNLEDLQAAVEWLRAEHGAPQLLIGHSLGGAAVLAAAAGIPGARAVATIGAPSETEHLRRVILRKAPDVEQRGEAIVDLGGRTFRIRRQLLDDLGSQRLAAAVGGLGKALAILHGPADRIVGIDHARRLFEAARHPKSFISLDRADHLLSDRRDARYVAEVLAAWAGRYLEDEAEDAAGAPPPEGVLVEGEPGTYTQRVRVRRHTLLADEPEGVGGADAGPTPYELLSAGLGTCTAMTLRMYADRKGWPLGRVTVRTTHRKIHARDCEECETAEGRLDLLERSISLGGSLSSEQRARLLEIADRCPVHRTLTSETVIRTRSAD